jgi:FKBP-type peptidyl-prolyl cis-trans isomerase FklB
MKKLILCSTAIFAVSMLHAQTKPIVAKTAAPVLKVGVPAFKNSLDSFSYAVGMSIGESLQQAGATNVNTQLLAKAMTDVYKKAKAPFTKEQANVIVQQTLQNYNKKKAASQKQECQSFLDLNKKKPGIISLPNGMQYQILKAGEAGGISPKAIDTVIVNYIGTLMNGTEFDNSFKRGSAATFPLNGVIKGWTEILQLMTKGAHWKVFIPSELAYGENPPSPQIPPNALLIFEITLEDIKAAITETK